MPGTNFKVLPKTLFDFSTLGSTMTQTVTVAKAIPAFQYREATLLVRWHQTAGYGFSNPSQYMKVIVRSEDPSPDDPSLDFVYQPATELATATVTTSGSAAPPLLYVQPVVYSGQNGFFGSYLRVVVVGFQNTGAATMNAYLSIDLALKSS